MRVDWIENAAMRVAAGGSVTDDFIRALRIIKRLREAVKLDCQDPDVCGAFKDCDSCKERKAALEYEGE